MDALDYSFETVYKFVKQIFFRCKWFEVYDFIEFIVSDPQFCSYKKGPNKKEIYPLQKEPFNREFTEYCNRILKEEMAAYRFVQGGKSGLWRFNYLRVSMHLA